MDAESQNNQGKKPLTKDDFLVFMDYAKTVRLNDMKELKEFFNTIIINQLEELKKKHDLVTSNLEKRILELEAKTKDQNQEDTTPTPAEEVICDDWNAVKKATVDQARKTIGLHSVNIKDLDRIKRTQDVTDEVELKLALAKEFFKYEMRMKEEDISALNISQVFYAVKNPVWNTLYVEFSDEESLSSCYKFAKNLKPGRRLFQYIPRMFLNRYKALNNHAYNLRHSSHQFKTRIRFGIDDILLLKCKPGESTWSCTTHANLPPVEVSTSRASFSSSQSAESHSSSKVSKCFTSSQSLESCSRETNSTK